MICRLGQLAAVIVVIRTRVGPVGLAGHAPELVIRECLCGMYGAGGERGGLEECLVAIGFQAAFASGKDA